MSLCMGRNGVAEVTILLPARAIKIDKASKVGVWRHLLI